MNKLERRLKGKFKFKKRLANFKYWVTNNPSKASLHALKTTGKPCSCWMCSPGKVEEKAKYRLNKFNPKNYEQNI
jgi:hypothetical protein